MNIPKEVSYVTKTLEQAGFEAYLVGGCVRDILMNKKPKDWDITTSAAPDQITSLFQHSHYDNEYGTVRIINENTDDETLKVIEVTTYRLEAKYSDGRRPDNVTFSQKLEDDIKRRDFTINAIALKVSYETTDVIHETNVVDIFGGIKDLKNEIIKAVGNPEERFNEDGLRILRAVRLSAELGFIIDTETEKAIVNSEEKLKNIATERIRDEFEKIVMSDRPMYGLQIANKLGILRYIAPELEQGIDVKQNKAHSFNVWEHLLRCVQVSADKKFGLEIRLAALFHDISKPEARRWSEEKKDYTFHGHDVIGAYETERVLERLKFSNKVVEKTTKLVRWHMFFSDTEQITLSAVRRLINNVGQENVWDLMNLRVTDRVGMGRPKEDPYRLRKYKSMVEEAMRDPISVKMLKINGSKIMDVAQETPGPRIGYILSALMEEVLDDPNKNDEKYLENKARELSKLSEKDIRKLGESGKERQNTEENKELKSIRGKYWVK